MIAKKLLSNWKKEANKDLEGLTYKQISEEIGENQQLVKNYMTLSNQKTFDPAIIQKINEYRKRYKEHAASLVQP